MHPSKLKCIFFIHMCLHYMILLNSTSSLKMKFLLLKQLTFHAQTTPYHPPSHHSHTCSVYGHYAHTVVPSTDILPILVTDNKDGMIKSIREQLCLQPFYSELGTPVVTVEDGTTLESTQAEFLSGLVSSVCFLWPSILCFVLHTNWCMCLRKTYILNAWFVGSTT